jgi:carboxymethylenebutenolidase
MTDLTVETIQYAGVDGPVRAYLARPDSAGPFPAIVIGMEAFGWAEHILDVARRFAELGYLTVMPDLYSGDPVRAQMTVADIEEILVLSRHGNPESEIAKQPIERRALLTAGLAWRQASMTNKTYVPNFLAAIAAVKGRGDVVPDRVGIIGYCMGGGIVGQALISGVDVAAAAIYYGRLPDPAAVVRVSPAFQGHFGELDTPITATVPAFQAAMVAAGNRSECFIYEDAPHAFGNDTRASYRPAAKQLAWSRVTTFFAEHLS